MLFHVHRVEHPIARVDGSCRFGPVRRKSNMRMTFKHLALTTSVGIALSSMLLLSGCYTGSHKTSDRSDGRMADDKSLNSEVKHELAAEPVYKFDDVDVKTYN